MKRIGGYRKKTRHKFQKHFKQKGKISITKFMQELVAGDKVLLKAEPGYHKGLYHQRFHGNMGTVIGPAGACYKIEIHDQDLIKHLIVHPVHLRKVEKMEESKKGK
jgi:ribosomal protein L21E